jgi:hypothetical protein
MAVILFSCNKNDEEIAIVPNYVEAIGGEFIPNDGDITLKSAPVVGGHHFNCWDKKVNAITGLSDVDWTVIDGTEFLPGSAPALDWDGFTLNTCWFSPTTPVYITYCPTLPMRVTIKATTDDNASAVSYLGIWEGIPDVDVFPINIMDRRLGDVLTLNTDALTALPGYTNLSFDVVYDKSIIDVTETELTSAVTDTEWPEYVYSDVVSTTTTLDATQSLGDRPVYDDLDAKITGIITINIHVDATTITKTVDAAALGYGLKLTLSTTRVGWYDSGTIGITENDIDLIEVEVPVN